MIDRIQRALFLSCFIVNTAAIAPMSSVVATANDADAPISPGKLGRDVNPFIGTGGLAYLCANNCPGASVPFGLVRLGPDTAAETGKRATNSSGYFYSDPILLGFSHTRLIGTGATDGGNFLTMPCSEAMAKSSRRGLAVRYSHEDEIAFPGYYAVKLPSIGCRVELTASPRVGVHRYRFTDQDKPHLLIHVNSVLGKGETKAGEVRVLAKSNEIEGTVTTFGTFSKRYGGLKSYFVARFTQPIHEFTTWNGDKDAASIAQASGDDVGVDLTFDFQNGPRDLEMSLAISHVSVANARANLDSEVAGKNFDEVARAAVARWEEVFERATIEGGTRQQRAIFRTALYRSFQMPTLFNDANGDYIGFDRKVHRTDRFDYYTDMSLWDTFRTVHPLFNLIARREQHDILVSLTKMAEQGGYLPRWPSGGGYSGSMFGSPADMVITESYLKGIRDFDVEAAYGFMKKTALGPVPQGAPFSGRVGVEHYLQHHYCPADLMKKSVASTIEYCYADQSIALLAAALGRSDEAKLFQEHAGYYRSLFNPETQFFQPRDSHGKFVAEFQPELLTYLDFSGKFTHGYVEGSAWQWRWGVPSDAEEVVKLFKSREYFVQELNKFFAESVAKVGVNPNAFYWHGNQPDIYAAFLFNAAGRPDLTQKWVRWILDSKYGAQENGIDGNDDGGTISAWYVLASLGLFPTAGTDRYVIVGPLWDRSEISLGDKRLSIEVKRESTDQVYIKDVWLNGARLDRRSLRHDEIANGGTLRYEMSAQPVTLP